MEYPSSIKLIMKNIFAVCMMLSLSFSFPAYVFSAEEDNPFDQENTKDPNGGLLGDDTQSDVNSGFDGSSSANTPSTLDSNSQNRNPDSTDNTTSNRAGGNQTGTGDVTGSLVSCSIGAIVGNVVKQAVSKIATDATSALKAEVPVGDRDLHKKEVGTTLPLTGTLILPSWDAVGFCLVNAIIDYIGQATVEWINNGFKNPDGSTGPVFVNDPQAFFAKIADEQAGQFLGEISDGLLCSPFKLDIGLNIATRANRNFRDEAKCTFTEVSGNIENFLSGKTFSYEDFISVTQNPANNPYGAEQLATAELNARIVNARGQERTLLDWGKGFLSFKDEEGKVTSPGAIIESQVNSRIDNPNQRLLIADEFDEIITALVNQLLKIAINEMTQSR